MMGQSSEYKLHHSHTMLSGARDKITQNTADESKFPDGSVDRSNFMLLDHCAPRESLH